jgi:ubiquinol-cytochrome c reductase cytochrome c subunit
MVMLVLAVVCGAGAIYRFAVGPAGAQKGTSVNPMPASPPTSPGSAAIARGRQLFLDGCSSCHGNDARGKQEHRADAGGRARAADFYLTTGRMPLSNPTDQPSRAPPATPAGHRRARRLRGLARPGPDDPHVDVAMGNITNGLSSFTLHCAGCHRSGAAGGIVTGAIAPALNDTDITPTQIAEAIRVGPT